MAEFIFREDALLEYSELAKLSEEEQAAYMADQRQYLFDLMAVCGQMERTIEANGGMKVADRRLLETVFNTGPPTTPF